MNDKILLFIPTYNLEVQILKVLLTLNDEVMAYVDDVIVVDDKSIDNTEEVVSIFIENHPDIPVRLLRNEDNYGIGGTYKVGFDYAIENGYDYIIALHGDDRYNINDFLPLLRRNYYEKHDFILGSRFMYGSRVKGYSRLKSLGNIIYNFLYAFVLKQRVFDLGSGLNMYNVKALKNRFYTKLPDNDTFGCCMLLAADYYGCDFKFFPVSYREENEDPGPDLRYGLFKPLDILLDYFRNANDITADHRDKAIDSYEAETVK